ncbi:MAG: precorrin-6y C5,15-methyltransferase (decarboxylating) subunit CbiE [Bacillota bacterium]
MAHPVKVIGIGPGALEYLIPLASTAIKEAEVLVGGPRALEAFGGRGKDQFRITADLESVVHFIKASCAEKKVAVLVSGDPGMFSMLDFLKKHFSPDELEVIPGISPVQLMFARLGRPWYDARVLSVHGRPVEYILGHVKEGGTIALLTDQRMTASRVARCLLENGVPDRRTAVGENLSYPEERIFVSTLKIIADREGIGANSVVVIMDE